MSTTTYPNNVKVNDRGQGNEIIIKSKEQSIKNINITISGNNNKIIFEEGGTNVGVSININGDDNLFFVDKNYRTFRGNFILQGTGQHIKVGKGAHFGNVGVNAQENTSIDIGDDALFSYQTEIRTTDSHSVLDLHTKERLNHARDIKIGNHVWIGMQAIISKGVEIPDDVIVGAKAMVVKSVPKSHVAIGGVPAVIIKEDVTWSLDRK